MLILARTEPTCELGPLGGQSSRESRFGSKDTWAVYLTSKCVLLIVCVSVPFRHRVLPRLLMCEWIPGGGDDRIFYLQ